jgi:(2Fe-2S) ferredoxin
MKPIDTFVYKKGVVYENVDATNGSSMRVTKLKNGAHVNNNVVGGVRVSTMVTAKNNFLMCIDIFP